MVVKKGEKMDKFDVIYKNSETIEMQQPDNLLPCPFCGGEAHMSGKFPHGQYYITCTGCRVSLWDDRQDKAIGHWNKRVKVS